MGSSEAAKASMDWVKTPSYESTIDLPTQYPTQRAYRRSTTVKTALLGGYRPLPESRLDKLSISTGAHDRELPKLFEPRKCNLLQSCLAPLIGRDRNRHRARERAVNIMLPFCYPTR